MDESGSKSTPEKQLLKLIEEPKAGVLRREIIKRKGFSLFSFGALRGRIAFFKDLFRGGVKFQGFPAIEFSLINRVLGVSTVVLFGYFILTFTNSSSLMSKIPDFNEVKTDKGVTSAGFIDSSLVKSLSYYLETTRQRNIFGPVKKIVEEDGTTKAGPSSAIVQATESLSLVGISWSNDPDVMIEDKKSQKTYFVKRGQAVGTVKVEAIYKDKVILSYQGEEIELK